MPVRDLEPGIVTDLADRLTYGGYLRLDLVLAAQQPLSGAAGGAPRHDEMLFIVQHQVSELWMKLMIHELSAAIRHVQRDDLGESFKILARVKLIQKQLFENVGGAGDADAVRVRELPAGARQRSSGFQSAQYRAIEFLLGNKQAAMVDVFRHDPTVHAELTRLLHAPLALRRVPRPSRATRPAGARATSSSATSASRTSAQRRRVPVFKAIYDDPKRWWDAYDMCEKLVDIEEGFQLWRFRHMKTVERIIGHKPAPEAHPAWASSARRSTSRSSRSSSTCAPRSEGAEDAVSQWASGEARSSAR